MRLMVTGAGGFVGAHLEPSLGRICGNGVEVLRTSNHAAPEAGIEALDVTDPAAIRAALERHRPTHVLNLAGVSAPAEAGRNPDLAWRVHVDGVRHLADAMRTVSPEALLVHAGTGLVYGASFASGTPLDETAAVEPLDQYGASKAAGDMALGVVARQGLRCLRMRPFNHSGPGQSEDFVLSAFAAQIARIEAGQAEPLLRVGNLDAARDFVDVRDVCNAYALALLRGAGLTPGTILNVASGTARRIADVLDALLSRSRAPIKVEQDPDRMRPAEVATARGDAGRIRGLLGWAPLIPFERTLDDVLDDWRARVSAGRADRPQP